MAEAVLISVDPPSGEPTRLWLRLIELSESFGRDEDWCLVGGLMVQLHAYERDATSRPTTDIDFLGNARARPSMTERLAGILDGLGATLRLPPATDPTTGYVFELDGETIEVLGSEGLQQDPSTLGSLKTIQVPGGNQALRRTQLVRVSVSGSQPATVRRPSLLGAILLKARALELPGDKTEEHREDLIRLLSFVDDPRSLAADEGLTKSERQWLRRVESRLALEDPATIAAFPTETQARARQAFALLLGEPDEPSRTSG